MQIRSRRFVLTASTALTLSLVSFAAQADNPLPDLTNLNFTSYAGSSPKGYFYNVDPTGWSGVSQGKLIFIDANVSHVTNIQAIFDVEKQVWIYRESVQYPDIQPGA